jgi:hypothetical protein
MTNIAASLGGIRCELGENPNCCHYRKFKRMNEQKFSVSEVIRQRSNEPLPLNVSPRGVFHIDVPGISTV